MQTFLQAATPGSQPLARPVGDIPNTPGVHGAGIATKAGHGFTTNSGDETVTMFDLKTLAALRQVKVGPGLDGIMYDEPDDKIILTNHSRPIGTLTAIDRRLQCGLPRR